MTNLKKAANSITKISIDDIKKAIHTVDLINRPFIAFAQPSVIKAIKELDPTIEDTFVLREAVFVEPDKIIVINRAELDKWTFGHDIFEKATKKN
ncbi:MAG: hypothetical protein J6M44_13960 [Butyrivibrio sp.]|nr:hypothetical protein [Butyrivibrio sp.]